MHDFAYAFERHLGQISLSHRQVAVTAMAKPLSNPNKALRQAVVHAMSVAEVEVAARTPVEQSQDWKAVIVVSECLKF